MSETSLRKSLLLLLCLNSGIVDVIGYLGLQHTFTANMTGNFVMLGLAIGNAQGHAVLRSLIALVAFSSGCFLSAHIIGRVPKEKLWTPSITVALMCEAGALLLFSLLTTFIGSASLIYLLIILVSVAMGVQTTAARKLNIAGISTTVLTSNLANVMEDFVAQTRFKQPKNPDSGLRLTAVVLYILGAALASIGSIYLSAVILWIPIGLLAVVIFASRQFWTPVDKNGEAASKS